LQIQNKIPIFVLIEIKTELNDTTPPNWTLFESTVLSALGRNYIFTPDDLLALNPNKNSVRDIATSKLWPDIGSVLDKVVLMILRNQPTYYAGVNSGLRGRTSFIAMESSLSYLNETAMISVDNPSDASVLASVNQGFLVRTRSDQDYCRGQENRTQLQINLDYYTVIDYYGNNNGLISTFEVSSFLFHTDINVAMTTINTLFGLCGASSGQANFTQWNCILGAASQGGLPVIPANPNAAQMMATRLIAFASGAHFISTDYPTPPFVGADPNIYFWAQISAAGYPYRCNIITTSGITCSDSEFNSTSISITTGFTTGITTGITTSQAPVTTSQSEKSSANSISCSFILLVIISVLFLVYN